MAPRLKKKARKSLRGGMSEVGKRSRNVSSGARKRTGAGGKKRLRPNSGSTNKPGKMARRLTIGDRAEERNGRKKDRHNGSVKKRKSARRGRGRAGTRTGCRTAETTRRGQAAGGGRAAGPQRRLKRLMRMVGGMTEGSWSRPPAAVFRAARLVHVATAGKHETYTAHFK
jgi:hypothetical protein